MEKAARSRGWVCRSPSLGALDRVLVVGSQLRKDHPLLASRLRKSAKKGTQVNSLNCLDDDLLDSAAGKSGGVARACASALAQIVRATAEIKQIPVPAAVQAVDMQTSFTAEAKRIAESLSSGQRAAVLLGNLAQHHPQAATLHRLGYELAQLVGANFGFLGEAANSVGGYVAGAVPLANTADMNARDMLAQPRRAYVLLNAEVELDCHSPHQALAAMRAAEFVVALSAFRHRALEYAHVLLPIAPFTETAGTFISTEGRVQSFVGVVPPLGETRPAWKVLRVLGSLLGIPGFEFTSAEEVRTQALAGVDLAARLSN